MRAFVTILVLATHFGLTSSFQSGLLSRRARSSLFSENALKKNAFYTKPSAPAAETSGVAVMSAPTAINTEAVFMIEEREVVEVSKEVNPMKARLVEEATKEDVRAAQLESLLEAFQSAIDEKEQLIGLESEILSEIKEVRAKVNDDAILSELNIAIEEKSKMIDLERGICKEISAVSASLATEITTTREKIANLRTVVAAFEAGNEGEDYQQLLKASVESSRSRDETVLKLINIFDAATSQKGLDEEDVPSMLNIITGEEEPAVTYTSIARLTLKEVRDTIKDKSNSELAATAGQAVGKTASALVAATSSILTAGASFVRSPEAKLSSDAVKSASLAASDMGKNIRAAWSAASLSMNSQEGEEGINKLVEGVKSVFTNPEVKAALSMLSENAQKTASDAARAAELASTQLGRSLKNSEKWRQAVSELNNSLSLLLSILSLSAARLLIEIRTDLNKQLPEPKAK